ncbi:MAG: aspartate kinase [Bacteroidales bacterium]
MIVYKFGGASVKDAGAIRNLYSIVAGAQLPLVVVVSALGKTTNALENVVNQSGRPSHEVDIAIASVLDYHLQVADELLGQGNRAAAWISDSVAGIRDLLSVAGDRGPDWLYDQIVSLGELWSTRIVEEYLRKRGLRSRWIDMREVLITDDRYRDANVIWSESERRLRSAVKSDDAEIFVLQGFIGATASGNSTTLGREGSDYTAAIAANILEAESVVIWKDVPGVLNADPGWMSDATLLDNISYKEAVEMSFSGAKVIHPKTIKPLHNRGIPLYVRSFLQPDGSGTVISSNESSTESVPVFIRKENQVLLSLLPNDFSFVIGENLGKIFHLFYRHGIKTNLVQASAVSIAVCVDNDSDRIDALTSDLRGEFSFLYNKDVEMISLRYYTEEAIRKVTEGKKVLLEQRTRKSVRFVIG